MSLIEELRELLWALELTQTQHETICEAIRQLGGNP